LQRDNRRYGHMKDRILISDAIRVVWKWMSAAWISTYGICMVSCDLSSQILWQNSSTFVAYQAGKYSFSL
jgi:hypothetical protein